MKSFFKIAGASAVLLVVVSLSALGWLFYEAHRAATGHSAYVALGSSFAAAPGVAVRDPNSPHLCARSADNYPHLLARKRQLDLTDVSCSGATAVHVLKGGQYFQGAQIDALRQNTKLVTITVGGNDVSYLGNMFAWSIQNRPEAVSTLWRSMIPPAVPQAVVDEKLHQLADTLRGIADVVRERSPQARLIFVDYTTILPDTGHCADRLPLTDEQLERSRAVAAEVVRITGDVARQTGADLIQASTITKGHDICSADPWVFGWELPRVPLSFAPMAYHPNDKAMHAIAQAIDERLGDAH